MRATSGAALSLAAIVLAHACLPTLALADELALAREKHFAEQVRPFVAKYCGDCHGGDAAEGEINFDGFTNADQLATTGRRTWKKVHDKLLSRGMPPAESAQPSDDERKAMVAWLSGAIDAYDCSGPSDPGRETIRRLNRVQYKNTIRDLLAVDAKLADDFPLDDVGYGFDNIGDVLTLSPLLMEKYLAAAESISEQAIVTDPQAATPSETLSGSRFEPRRGGRDGLNGLSSNGDLTGTFEIPRDGEYRLVMRAHGDQAGDEPPRVELRIDGDLRETFEVKAAEDKPAYYEYRGKFERGSRKVTLSFINDYYDPENPNPRERDRNFILHRVRIVGPLNAGAEQFPESHRRIFFVQPGKDLTETQAAEKIVQRLASRAFRRPATASEISRLVKLAEEGKKQGGNFEAGIQLALQAILVSPHFLFKVVADPPPGDADNIRDLDEYELAARLSYFLWSSMPDDELFALAHRGQLRRNLEPQVRRMLADPKAEALVENFGLQWLGLRNLTNFEPDRRRFTSWTRELRDDLLTETKLFLAAVVKEDRSVLELIDADFTYLNNRLAEHYDIDGITSEEFKRVQVRGSDRGGVLTMGSVLAVTSNPTRTSPVKRGKWIMENILGTPPAPPPPNVPELQESRRGDDRMSLRERMEVHRQKAECSVCHDQMDALGFAFENFDAVGAWRSRDGRFEVNASGKLPDGQEFSGAKELKQLLLANQRDDFVRCLSEKMLTYALGRGVEYYDQCTLDRIAIGLERDNFKFSRLVLEIVKSDPFQKRRGK